MISKMLVISTLVASTHGMAAILGGQENVCGPDVCYRNSYEYKNEQCVFRKTGEACDIPACNQNGPNLCTSLADPMNPIKLDAPNSGNSIGLTTPTSNMKSGILFNGMQGWRDIPDSEFFNYPPSLIGRRSMTPSVFIKKEWTVEFDCVVGGVADMCDAFVLMYRCPPCEFQDGGNLPLDLLADEWQPYACDVKFMLDKDVPTHHHDVMVYHRQIPAGQYVDVAPRELLELTWFASSPATSHCQDFTDKETCETTLPGECEWDGEFSSCGRVLCPETLPPKPHNPHPRPGGHKPHGPWEQKCKVCIEDERAYMPTLA